MTPPATSVVQALPQLPALTQEYLGMAGIGALAIVGYVVNWLRGANKDKDKALPAPALTVLSSEPNQLRLALEALARIEAVGGHSAARIDEVAEEQIRVARALKASVGDLADQQSAALRSMRTALNAVEDALRLRPTG